MYKFPGYVIKIISKNPSLSISCKTGAPITPVPASGRWAGKPGSTCPNLLKTYTEQHDDDQKGARTISFSPSKSISPAAGIPQRGYPTKANFSSPKMGVPSQCHPYSHPSSHPQMTSFPGYNVSISTQNGIQNGFS